VGLDQVSFAIRRLRVSFSSWLGDLTYGFVSTDVGAVETQVFVAEKED
jgi:hypothetical protein